MAGAEQPDRHLRIGTRRRHDLPRLGRAEQRLQLHHIVRKIIAAAFEIAAERLGGAHVGAGRAAEAEIDPSRIERLERAELLGDHQRRMVGQHDAAGAHSDRPGAGRHMRNDRSRGGAGNADHAMMLGQPDALEIMRLGLLRQPARIVERIADAAAFGDRREIEEGKGNHRRSLRTDLQGFLM